MNTPVIGREIDKKAILKKKNVSDPKLKNKEAVVSFNGTHAAFTRYDFKK